MRAAVLYEELSDIQSIVLHAVNYGVCGEGTLWNTQDTRALEDCNLHSDLMKWIIFNLG